MGKPFQKALIALSIFTLMALFAYSGIIKIFDLNAFYKSVSGYRVFPEKMILVITYWMPGLEIACALGLALKSLRKGASVIVSVLLVAFIVLLLSAWMRGINIDCGCFGKSTASSKINLQLAIVRDVCMLVLSVFLMFKVNSRRGV